MPRLGANFIFDSEDPNFARDQYATVADMAAVTTIDEGHIAFCLATHKTYEFRKYDDNNQQRTANLTYGYWVEKAKTVVVNTIADIPAPNDNNLGTVIRLDSSIGMINKGVYLILKKKTLARLEDPDYPEYPCWVNYQYGINSAKYGEQTIRYIHEGDMPQNVLFPEFLIFLEDREYNYNGRVGKWFRVSPGDDTSTHQDLRYYYNNVTEEKYYWDFINVLNLRNDNAMSGNVILNRRLYAGGKESTYIPISTKDNLCCPRDGTNYTFANQITSLGFSNDTPLMKEGCTVRFTVDSSAQPFTIILPREFEYEEDNETLTSSPLFESRIAGDDTLVCYPGKEYILTILGVGYNDLTTNGYVNIFSLQELTEVTESSYNLVTNL